MSDIASEASVSKGALYLHYTSKDELFEDLLLREMVTFTEVWVQSLEDGARHASFHTLYTAALGAVRNNPLLSAYAIQDKRVLGRLLDNTSRGNLLAQRNQATRTLIHQMQASGVARDDIDADATAYMFTMLAYGYFRLPALLPGIEPPTDVLVNSIGALFEQAVLKPDADPVVVHSHIVGLAGMARHGVDQLRAARQARRSKTPPDQAPT